MMPTTVSRQEEEKNDMDREKKMETPDEKMK